MYFACVLNFFDDMINILTFDGFPLPDFLIHVQTFNFVFLKIKLVINELNFNGTKFLV